MVFVVNWRDSMTSALLSANIEVVDVDLAGDRRLMLRHAVAKGALLVEPEAKQVLQHLADLWSYDVSLIEVDANDVVLKEYVASPEFRLPRPRSLVVRTGRTSTSQRSHSADPLVAMRKIRGVLPDPK